MNLIMTITNEESNDINYILIWCFHVEIGSDYRIQNQFMLDDNHVYVYLYVSINFHFLLFLPLLN